MLRGWQSGQVPGRYDRAADMRQAGLASRPARTGMYVPATIACSCFPLIAEAGVSAVTKGTPSHSYVWHSHKYHKGNRSHSPRRQ